ncbi:nudix hydrolase 8 [Rosa sericea]
MSVMEMSLFQSKSMSASEMAQVGRMYSNSFTSFRYLPVGIKVSPQFCSCACTGNPLKASSFSHPSSSNNRYLSTNAIGSVGGDKLAAETSLFQIFGTNGARSNLFPRDIRVLDAFDDEYGGVIVDPERLPENADAFAYILHSSLSNWKMEGKKGIWLKLPVERAELVPVAVKEGFQYHHAERGYVMLTYWIPEGPCMLPANASHQVGVGGFVINANNEVLVVQEKHCAPTCVGFWKIPTGFILESEEIFTGAVREVKEETGIDTEFVEVIAFRHAHNVAFEKSDLFFICMLKPLSTQIIVDDLEIEAAKWMPLAEFVEQPLVKEDSMFKKVISICIARLGKRYCGLSSHQVVSKFDGRLSSLYYNVVDTQDFNCSNC